MSRWPGLCRCGHCVVCWPLHLVWAQAARGGHGGIRAVGAFDGNSSPALSSTGNNFSGLNEKRAAVTEGPSPPCVRNQSTRQVQHWKILAARSWRRKKARIEWSWFLKLISSVVVLAVEEAIQINWVEGRGCSDRVGELKRISVVGAGGVGDGERLNLVELMQEEAAQMRELTHGTLCLGDGMPPEMVLKCQKYYKRILQVKLCMRWLSLGILETANGLRLSYLVCTVSKPPKAETSLCLSQVSVEKVGTKADGWHLCCQWSWHLEKKVR